MRLSITVSTFLKREVEVMRELKSCLRALAGGWVVCALLLPPGLAVAAEHHKASPRTAAGGVVEPAGYFTGNVNSPVPASLHGGKVIHVQALSKLVLAGNNLVIVDVSNAPVKPANLAAEAPWEPPLHRGIPGALWIPGVGMGVVPASVDAYFKQRLATLTGNDPDRPLIIYCHEKCWLSWNAAKRALSYGYHNVSWFPEGIEGWRATGLATSELHPEATPHEEAPPASPAPANSQTPVNSSSPAHSQTSSPYSQTPGPANSQTPDHSRAPASSPSTPDWTSPRRSPRRPTSPMESAVA
jgi:PQQ-dependent catabolism-associated CXXCW motif protein